jgi:hypothetical protein
MPKATIIVTVDELSEVASIEAWFARWKDRLAFISDNQGCGCCVDIWDIEGSQEAINELPVQCNASSEWSRST